jgi:DNA-binding NarL/FixJ family response regulator
MDPKMAIRIALVEDHALVREGVAAILSQAGMEVVGQASDGRTALGMVRRLRPDVALIDVALPGLSGLELCRRIRRRLPTVWVVLLSMFDDPAWRVEASRAGASAYVLKGERPEVLVDVIHRAARGETLLPPPQGEGLPLTPREREVVQLIAEGRKLGEIVELLSRSPATVRAHKAAAMRKLGAHSTAELVRLAYAHGIVKIQGVPNA